VDRISILFVCLGNHCRSPAAHAIAAKMIDEAGLSCTVDSAGTSNEHAGQLPHRLSVAEGKRRGYHVGHRSRQITESDFVTFDLIVGMDRSNIAKLARLQGNNDRRSGWFAAREPNQIHLLRRWDPAATDPECEVDDPWAYGPDAYIEMYDVLERSIRGLIDHLSPQAT
jgi:protein-tyrosine phosphatase